MKSLLKYYSPFITRLSIIMVIYSLFRLLFYFFNASLFPELSVGRFVQVLLGGIRFDLSIVLYSNLIFILIWILPFQLNNYPWIRTTLKWLFISINAIAIAIQATDVVFYPFNGKRMDIEVLGLLQTLPTLAGQFIVDYWYVLILYIVVIWVLYKLYEIPKDTMGSIKFIPHLGMFFLFALLTIVGMRGGVTNPRPLSPASATFHTETRYLPLVTNSVFTFFYSMVHQGLDIPNYYTEKDLKRIFPVIKEAKQVKTNLRQPNIVLLIMESFSKAYIGALNEGKGQTPYLDSIILKNTSCTNAFANGRRSSQGLAALTSGIPALMNEPFLHSSFLGNKIVGVPELLSAAGYKTAFFNGSLRNLLGWNEYITNVGYSKYYSREDYNNDQHFDGNWGIYDHYMFDYLLEVIDSTKEPFFYTFFSLSSHHPFSIPPDLQNKFSNNGSEYYNALRYADWSLGRFLARASKKKCFENTIFIITADHTLSGESFVDENNKIATSMYQNRVGLYSIPLVVINPFDSVKSDINEVVSQVDIAESILGFAGIQKKHLSWGNDIFEDKNDNLAIQYVNGIFQIENDEFVLLFDGTEVLGFYKYKEDFRLEDNLIGNTEYDDLTNSMLSKLKAAIQQHHSRMLQNRLFAK